MNNPDNISGDKVVDSRYGYLRNRHGDKNPMANGYRLGGFFEREQIVLLSEIEKNNEPIFDVACGSGLMLAPLIGEGLDVYGLDFNEDACNAARKNSLKIIRGDAFNMPFPKGAVGQIVNCQFLNQQPAAQTEKFIRESARVLKKGGRLVVLWRHAHSLIHLTSHALFSIIDKFTGQPSFPQYPHPLEEIRGFARGAGFHIEKEAVTLPFLKPDLIAPGSMAANIFGASFFIVLKKL